MISALSGDGVDDLRQALAKMVPAGPFLYPEDQMSDAPMRHLAAEITREQLYRQLHEEVSRFANVLKSLGVKKGDRVALLGIGSGLNCSMAEVVW